MDAVCSATSLGRTLLALSRARATGRLEVYGACAHGRISLVGGTPRAVMIEGDDETLGDVLARRGALDPRAHREALGTHAAFRPVGEWLVDAGVVSRPALVYGLREQMRRRVRRMCRWSGARYAFHHGARQALGDVEPIEEPVPAADLVLDGLRDVAADVPLARVRAALGGGVLALTELGRALVDEAALWPEEAALVALLRQGMSADRVLAATGGAPRALRGLWVLRAVRAVAPPDAASAAYSLLLRKHRQLRDSSDPMALLDLPPNAAPEDARRALRRLARTLHPDRFGEGAPPAVQRVSGEVMTALVSAEHTVRTASPG